MSNRLNEKEVLKELDIPDFRHITKDKVIEFTSMLSDMAPEVAKKALEQFPKFAEMTTQVIINLKESIVHIMDGNSESQNQIYQGYLQILTTQQERLTKGSETLTEAEKNEIINKMVEIVDKMSAKDTENKRYLASLGDKLMKTGLFAVGVGAVVLGGKFFKRND